MNSLDGLIKIYYSEKSFVKLIKFNCELNETIDEITSTGKIILPKNDTWSDKDGIYLQNRLIPIGSRIIIELGYTGSSDEIFRGYITSFKNAGDMLEINIMDEFYAWSTTKFAVRFSNSWKEAEKLTLKQFIQYIMDFGFRTDYQNSLPYSTYMNKIHCMNINLGGLDIGLDGKMTPLEVMQLAKQKWGIHSYFRDNELYIGYKYWDQFINGWSKRFPFSKPAKDNYYRIISSDLDYKIIDFSQYKVKGVSTLSSHKTIKYEFPENRDDKSTSNIITLNLVGIDKESLKTLVKERYYKLNKGGLTASSIKTFGYPRIRIGDIVKVDIDTSYVRHSPKPITENYYVDGVKTFFGTDGYKQELQLGIWFDYDAKPLPAYARPKNN